jgi:capsid protein
MAPTRRPMPRKAGQFNYQASEDKGRRQAPRTGGTRSEDLVLRKGARSKLVATARDQRRNYALLAWAIRRHVDYVSKFNPLFKTGNDELDKEMERRLKAHGKKRDWDVAKRHSRNEAMRIFEAGKVTDGDCGFIMLDGGKMQGIESDRICKPTDIPREIDEELFTEHGLHLDPSTGETLQYMVTRRAINSNTMLFDQIVDASNMAWDGYLGRFDQTRGISPLACALNMCADAHEAFEWTQLKIKFHAILGLQINRATTSEVADGFPTLETSDSDTDAAGAQTDDNRYQFDPSGLTMFDMDPGESVSPIESNTPSTEFTDYSHLMIQLILLALDIPMTAFDSARASYSARVADREEYEKSAQGKREKNTEVLEIIYERVIADWYANDPTFTALLNGAGFTPEQVNDRIEWTGEGTPWLDKLKEANGDAVALYNGTDSRQRQCKKHGNNFFEIIDEQAEEIEYAKKKGINLVIGMPGQSTVAQVESEVDNNE